MNIPNRILDKPKQYFITLALLIVLSSIIQILSSQASYASSISASEINSLSNQQRAISGISALTIDSRLSNAAYQKANHMIANNYWGHFAPDGTSPWYFISANGYDYLTVGENLAKDFSTSSQVVYAWMNSSSHRLNILKSNFVDVGYAIVDGMILGDNTTLIVAMYGAPLDNGSASPAQNQTNTVPTSTHIDENVPNEKITVQARQPSDSKTMDSTLIGENNYDTTNKSDLSEKNHNGSKDKSITTSNDRKVAVFMFIIMAAKESVKVLRFFA